jgi:hypothetical protein
MKTYIFIISQVIGIAIVVVLGVLFFNNFYHDLKIIDGCEYRRTGLLSPHTRVHSGTCPNPIHPENWTASMWREKLGLEEPISRGKND